MIKLDKKSRILVTGGSGFIGSSLTKKLTSEGFRCDGLSEENGDIRDRKLNLDGYNVIYHLAAISNPRACEDNQEVAWDVNVNGTRNILEKLGKNQKLVFASTAHVYGREKRAHREEDNHHPNDFYGLTKKVCEDLIGYYSKKEGFSFTVIRFFNIYGSNQARGFLIPDIIGKYKSEKVIEVLNPNAQRDFLHVKDAVDALVKAANVNGIFNIASGKSTKIMDVYQIIEKEMGITNVAYKMTELHEDVLYADITKARKEMGWKPRISLEEGLAEVIKHYTQVSR